MSYNGSGTFIRLTSWQADAQAGIKIKSDRHDLADDDVANALSQVVTKDGQSQPTANLPMNGHVLINTGDPVNPTDSANKKYVDAIKSFSTGLEISGADAQGQLKFTSTTGVNGLAFVGADLGWFARLADATATPPKLNRLVLNDKVDGSGTDVVVVNDDGTLTYVSATAITMIIKALTGNDVLRFQGPNAEDRMKIYTAADTESSGFLTMKGSVNFEFTTGGQFKAVSTVYAGGAFLETNGNVQGSIWTNWGAWDAYSAINARIENRAAAHAQAWANDRVANLQYRLAGLGSLGGLPGWGTWDLPAGTVCVGATVDNYKWTAMRYRYPQVYDPVRGWVGFQNA